ncbi:hypothetical protein A1O3_07836 [Capronia epimyces CBS 606.96]|uniref:NAD-dependent epimerase/dehydratase domain-containing protein n=1 Tax=Capronia epimyces CBS 606.96 TaxID=1182542 RepID=W9XGC0_9EURO|nr:uncharacterized protein A1O3_07836 [Capronia epimyces CBS 606.96]EXJ79557.1 hypothetical protein A1O3_07836 [Capronia epimyces CBS 606.96]
MPPTEPRIPKGDTVLVTGANGYIASHVVDVLLDQGYKVRGTVRAPKPWLNRHFDAKYGAGKFETAILSDLEDEAGFDHAVKGVSGVIHVASDVSFNSDPDLVIPKVVAGTVNVLKAAAKEPRVKSVVLTSSSNAVVTQGVSKNGLVIDQSTWNDTVVQAAYSKDTPAQIQPLVVYAASKTEGERAFWKWVADNKPRFTTNSVLPDLTLGKILLPEIPGSTMSWAASLLKGQATVIDSVPPQWFVDVRDAARLHVVALLDPQVKSERLFAFSHEFNWTDVIGIFKKLRPENTQIPQAPENEGRDLTDVHDGSQRAEHLLQSFFGVTGWTSLEDSLRAGIEGS